MKQIIKRVQQEYMSIELGLSNASLSISQNTA